MFPEANPAPQDNQRKLRNLLAALHQEVSAIEAKLQKPDEWDARKRPHPEC